MEIRDILVKLLLKQPYYGSLAASIPIVEHEGIQEIRSVIYPEPMICYNREWFSGLEEKLATGSILHELLHLIFLHGLRRGDRDSLLWEAACELAVNEFIPEELLRRNALTAVKVMKEFHEVWPPKESAEVYYERLSQLGDKMALFDKESEISIKTSSGQELIVQKQMPQDTDTEITEVGKRAVENRLEQLLHNAVEEGEIPEGLFGQVETIYTENQVDWKNIFKRFLIGRGRMETRRSYKKESRRYEGFPGSKRSIGLRCLLAIDESGSIPDGQVIAFYQELMEINQITNAEIYVTEFDTTCSPPVLLQHYMKQEKRMKNGGTDFRPVFELADQMHMELLICFTDGDGIAPEQVNQKVMWVLTKNGEKPAPYGFEVKL